MGAGSLLRQQLEEQQRPTREQITARVMQKLGPNASAVAIERATAQVEAYIAQQFAQQEAQAATAQAAVQAANPPAPAEPPPPSDIEVVGSGVLRGIRELPQNLVEFGKHALRAVGKAVEFQTTRDPEAAQAVGQFAVDMTYGLLEPVADVAALAASTAAGHVSEEERKQRLERAGHTLVNLVALEVGGRAIGKTIEGASRYVARQSERAGLTPQQVGEQLQARSPEIVAAGARATADNGAQSARAPALKVTPEQQVLRDAQHLDTPQPSRFGAESGNDVQGSVRIGAEPNAALALQEYVRRLKFRDEMMASRTVPAEVSDLLKQLDNFGFDNTAQAASAILRHLDWAARWDVPAKAIETLQRWKKQTLREVADKAEAERLVGGLRGASEATLQREYNKLANPKLSEVAQDIPLTMVRQQVPPQSRLPTMAELLIKSQREIAAERTRVAQQGAARIRRTEKIDATSPNAEIESFFQETATTPARSSSIVDFARDVGRRAFIQFQRLRTNPRLPETAQFNQFFADAREALRQGIDAGRNANTEAASLVARVVHRMRPDQLEAFRRIIFLRDLSNTATRGIRVPRDLSPEAMGAELARLESIVRSDPVLQQALQARVELRKTLGEDLVQRGILTREQVDANPHYVTHQVLDFLETRGMGGSGSRLRRLWRGYKQQRKGSARDIYTDYLEVEYSNVARTLRDNAIDDVVTRAAASYDVTARPLPERAQALTAAAARYNEGLVARGKKPVTLRLLPDEVLESAGYARYFPAASRVFYRTRTMAESTMTRIMEEMARDPEIKASQVFDPTMFRESLGVGRGQSYIVPRELRDVLESYRDEFHSPASGFVPWFVRGFKQLVLNINPFRYNRRNFIGDTERTWAAMPSALPLLKRAVTDQINQARGNAVETFTMPDGTVRSRLDLAAERSVISSGRTAVEVGRVRELQEFEKFGKGLGEQFLKHPLRFLSQHIRRVSQFREDWLRLATFYKNLDNIAKNKPLEYGVSDRRIVDAISDPIDRAAKVSREALGDYQGLTKFENGLRNGIMPFYAWLKINSSFWPLLVTRQSLSTFSRYGALRGARATAWLAGRVGFVYAAVQTWNNMVQGEQEDALPNYVRERFHFNTGMKDEHGRWITLTDPTALDDFLQTVGLNGASPDLRSLFQGQLTMTEFLQRQGENVLRGPARAVLSRFGPEVSIPLAAVGKSLFPDPFNPRDVPVGNELEFVLSQTGIPPAVIDAAQAAYHNDLQGVAAALQPDVGALPTPLGTVATKPLREPSLVTEVSIEASQLNAYLEDIAKRQANIFSGLSLPNATPEERSAEIRRLDEILRTGQQQLTTLVQREAELRRRAASR